MRKKIALSLAAALLAGSVPGWADSAPTAPDRAPAVRSSVDRAVAQLMHDEANPAMAPVASAEQGAGPALSGAERRDLEQRHAALKKDPVARGGGSAAMILVGTALSIGASVYLIHELNKNNNTQATAH